MVLRTGTTRKTMKWIKKIYILPFCFLVSPFFLALMFQSCCENFRQEGRQAGNSSFTSTPRHTEIWPRMNLSLHHVSSSFEIIATTACENVTRPSKVAKWKQMEMLNLTNWTSCDRAGFISHLSLNSNKLKLGISEFRMKSFLAFPKSS